MRSSLLLLTAILAFTLSSCFDMVEEVYLNRDGTGRYEYTIDMSALFSDPFMGQLIAESIAQETGGEALEIDSLIALSSLAASAGNLTAVDRAILNRGEMRMQLSQSKGLGIIKMTLPFNQLSDVNRFNEIMASMQSNDGSNPMAAMGMPGGMSPVTSIFSLSGKMLTREVQGDGSPLAGMEDDENMQMVKMMLTDANYRTVYHLPGKVRRNTFKNATVEGNTLTLSTGLLDLIEGRANLAGEVKFR